MQSRIVSLGCSTQSLINIRILGNPFVTLRRVALLRIDVPEERITSIISVTRIGEVGTTLIVNSLVHRKHRLLQEPHGV
jgi:hypothetical protein